MNSPRYPIKANQDDGSHQRNPSWCVAFLRYIEPCAMHLEDTSQTFAIKDIMVVENDCIAVSINNPKNGFTKTASITMATGEIWYPNAVSAGDWVLIWMADSQDHIDNIIAGLYGQKNNDKRKKIALNDFKSGLKFVGRVTDLGAGHSVAGSGQVSLTQTIGCQAFTEMANSIYYTYISEYLTTNDGKLSSLDVSQNFVKTNLDLVLEQAGAAATARDLAKQEAVTRYGKIENLVWPNEKQWIVDYQLPSDLEVNLEANSYNSASFNYDKKTRRIISFKINKDAVEPLDQAIERLRLAGKLSEWKEMRASFAIREVFGVPGSLSTHSYGLALDINPSSNKWGEKPSLSAEFVNAFVSQGWTWGGYFRKPDGMHFSLAWEGVSTAVTSKEDPADNTTVTVSEEDEDFQKQQKDKKKTSNGINTSLSNLATNYFQFFSNKSGANPETIIALLFTIIMGIDKEKSLSNALADSGLRGQFGDGIGIPKELAAILRKPKAVKLWQLYTVILGLQKYVTSTNVNKPWESFFPILDDASSKFTDAVFYRTTIYTKGFVPFSIPPVWDNNSLWNILNQFLNPVVNELYVALKINKDNKIMPTMVVREQPYSTDLYDYLILQAPKFKLKYKGGKLSSSEKLAASANKSEETEKNAFLQDRMLYVDPKGAQVLRDLKERTFYNNIPRWAIDESMIRSYSASCSEQRRVNFVQVWGRSRAAELSGAKGFNAEEFKFNSFKAGNYVADEVDISRHGLRANISETVFDKYFGENAGSLAPQLSRMRADWLFNGHLKLYGSITMNGITEPICEGDNIEFKGLLFHIENISHSGNISGNGQKEFTTVATISNGILSNSVDVGELGKRIPNYLSSLGDTRTSVERELKLPGKIDVQATRTQKNRDATGEIASETKQNKDIKGKIKKVNV